MQGDVRKPRQAPREHIHTHAHTSGPEASNETHQHMHATRIRTYIQNTGANAADGRGGTPDERAAAASLAVLPPHFTGAGCWVLGVGCI